MDNKGLKKIVAIGEIVIAVAGVGVLAMDSSDIDLEKENIKIASEQGDSEIKEVEIEKAEENIKLPSYKVERVDSSEYAGAISDTLHVLVNGEYTNDDLYKIAEKEIKAYTIAHKVNAVTVGFYKSEDHVGKGYEMGYVEYVPNGNRTDALIVTAGDYSSFQFVDYLQDETSLSKSMESGVTNLDLVKKDFSSRRDEVSEISKEGNTLKAVIEGNRAISWGMGDEDIIRTYTDCWLDNIKNDIKVLDITVKQDPKTIRAVLKMSEMKTEEGRLFSEDYIIANLK